jgi:hypothetical protein
MRGCESRSFTRDAQAPSCGLDIEWLKDWMNTMDRMFSCILILSCILHGFGAYVVYKNDPLTLLWALCAVLLGILLAILNLLRAGRHADRALGWICLAGNLTWSVAAFTYTVLLHNIFDVRGSIDCITGLALVIFSLPMAAGARAKQD